MLYIILKFHEEGKISSMKSLTTVMALVSADLQLSVRLLADILDGYNADSSLYCCAECLPQIFPFCFSQNRHFQFLSGEYNLPSSHMIRGGKVPLASTKAFLFALTDDQK